MQRSKIIVEGTVPEISVGRKTKYVILAKRAIAQVQINLARMTDDTNIHPTSHMAISFFNNLKEKNLNMIMLYIKKIACTKNTLSHNGAVVNFHSLMKRFCYYKHKAKHKASNKQELLVLQHGWPADHRHRKSNHWHSPTPWKNDSWHC